MVFSARETKLEPVLRSVAVPEDGCPAAAVQALVAGPTAVEKKSGLGPVLPASTRVLGVKVADGVAVVDLSREVITRASEIGASSTTEALALNALYFTLAQFRGVEKVKLLVEGKNRGAVDGMRIEDFWGHIGLPDCLSGSPSLLDVSPRQEVGEPIDGLWLASVRWSAHPGLFRLVFQLEGPEGETSPIIPATVATYSATARVIGITINGVRGTKVAALAPGQKVQLGDWRAEVVRWDTLEDDRAYAFSLALRPVRAYGWRLWSLADPARIIVDVFACGP
ncbi:MAG: GerMN domain-containing protein [Bacillota bacterium]